MGRDLEEFAQEGGLGWTFLVLFFSMPVVALLLLVVRRWIAVIPLTGWAALNVAWFLYYATDWFGPVSGGAVGLVFLLLVGGWVLVLVAAAAPHRWTAIFGGGR
jgi:hypothetical protein